MRRLGEISQAFLIYKYSEFNYIIVMKAIVKIEWLERYDNNCGKKGSVSHATELPLIHVRTQMKWFGLELVQMEQCVNGSYNREGTTIWFAEPAVMTAPPGHMTGEYDQRISVVIDGTEIFKMEMLKDNYKPGSHEPFALCEAAQKCIETCKAWVLSNNIQ